jgi:hypothetical protein
MSHPPPGFRWYGSNPLHLLALIGSFALAGYAGLRLFDARPMSVAVWLFGAVIAHDLMLFPLYALADRSIQKVLQHRPAPVPAVPWINHLRVPVLLSALLLLVYFPLILGYPPGYTAITGMPLSVYFERWLLVTGVLFTASALAFALRLRRHRRRDPDIAHRRGERPPPDPDVAH